MTSNLEWPSDKVRKTFIEFFSEKHGHTYVPSAPVLPYNDPTLLFINSGMAQFKDIFLGQVDPRSPEALLKRAANSQKCIRAGGKHNDLDDVGKDTYHHTYFEMLGNWSFGDYFQEEAISWAWELLTEVYGLDPERLYVTYFCGDVNDGLPADDIAKELWKKYLPESRILPFDKGDNFWEMGDTGPCGPCTEIHYDRIGGRDAASLVNADDPMVLEIWNLVFMQFNREKSGALTDLPNKHVDTGMGFERLTSILQDKPSNYDTDVFEPIFNAIHEMSSVEPYTGLVGEDDVTHKDTAYRIIADHIRTLTFSISDGILPGKVGRGNVLRRIVRRAIRAGRDHLGIEGVFIQNLVDVVVEKYGDFFESLKSSVQVVKDVLIYEQNLFSGSLDKGMNFFRNVVARLEKNGSNVLDGNTAFLMYSSHGFPLDLIQIICEDFKLTLDVDSFNAKLEEDSAISHQLWADRSSEDKLTLDAACISTLKEDNITTTNQEARFVQQEIISKVLGLRIGTSENGSFIEKASDSSVQVGVILDATNFYAESGGQIFDTGMLVQDEMIFHVTDVQVFGGYVVHIGNISSGEISVGDSVGCNVNYERREPIMSNHTATHLLNFALRQVIGDGLDQRGSLVVEDKFRFDFTYHKEITTSQLRKVEYTVNSLIAQELPVYVEEVPLEKASEISGIRNVFGEKYPDPVRVVSVGADIVDILSDPDAQAWTNYSMEYCGGTHVQNTKVIESFTIVEEGGKGSGERRITALTGDLANQAVGTFDTLLVEFEKIEKAEDKDLHQLCLEFENELNKTYIPAYQKPGIRERLGVLQDRATVWYKEQLKAMKESASDTIQDVIAQLSEDNNNFAVAQYQVTGKKQNKLLVDAANSILQAVGKDVAVMLISVDEEAGKIIYYATVGDSLLGSIQAGNWVKEVSAAFSGKGGGKDANAQGFHQQVDKFEETMDLARNYATTALN